MRKVKLYIATSLNGFIARMDHSVDWLNDIPVPQGEDYGYQDFYNSCGITIQGHNTYKFILNSGHDFPYTSTENYVFTTNQELENNTDVKFIATDHLNFVKDLKCEDGKDIWLIGGAQLNSFFFEHSLIDELWIHIMPIVLQEGIKLTEKLHRDVSLELLESKSYSSGVMELKYKIKSKR